MENKFQLILYIVFGVIYVISRFMKSKRAANERVEEEGDGQRPKPVSFEDLLREFTGEVAERNEEPKVEKHPYEFETEVPLESEIDKVYQEAVTRTPQYEELDATKLRHKVEYSRFDEFEKEDKSVFLDDLMESIDENEGLKKAVIYKEILDRKF